MGEGNNGRLAMGVLMFSSIFSIGFLSYSIYGIFKEDLFEFEKQDKQKTNASKRK